jgi:parvulin-like peptidyl-prolyl isomerase
MHIDLILMIVLAALAVWTEVDKADKATAAATADAMIFEGRDKSGARDRPTTRLSADPSQSSLIINWRRTGPNGRNV